MFNKNNTSSQNLEAWRKLRQSDLTLEEIVCAFNIPIEKSRYIDYYTPASWPNVFEIVSEGMFCQSGISLVLASTIHNAGFMKTDKIQFDIISNNVLGTEGLVLNYQRLYYNFMPGKISSVDVVRENGIKFDTHIITVDKLFR